MTSLSLLDRCKMFRKEFPTAKLNPTLLRKIYGQHKIKKKKIAGTNRARYKEPTKHKPI